MKERDFFEYKRAREAGDWLNHPDRIMEDKIDLAHRAARDIKAGHLPLVCSLTRCHPNCPKLFKK